MAWLLIGGAVATSLLTLYVMMLVWSKGFLRSRADAPEGHLATARPAPLAEVTDEVEITEREDVGRLPFGMLASTAVLVAASVSITIFADPLTSITDRAAEAANDVETYRSVVLGDTGAELDPGEPGRDTDISEEVD